MASSRAALDERLTPIGVAGEVRDLGKATNSRARPGSAPSEKASAARAAVST